MPVTNNLKIAPASCAMNNSSYKKKNMDVWNEVAPRYHKRWASKMHGPLQSTTNLIKDVKVKKGDRVLDVACGTGLVSMMLGMTVGDSGYVIGADMSMSAIKIAQKNKSSAQNISFVNADAENLAFAKKFDIVTCQYGLFFFPDAPKALKNMRRSLKKSGRLGIVVHGSKDKAPFYGAILDAASKFIPDYIPQGTPQLDRYSTKRELREEVRDAGFSNIIIREYVFSYSPGTFENYWRDYLRYVAKPIKEKINAQSRSKRRAFQEAVRNNTIPYTDSQGIITFPWQVLVLVAMR